MSLDGCTKPTFELTKNQHINHLLHSNEYVNNDPNINHQNNRKIIYKWVTFVARMSIDGWTELNIEHTARAAARAAFRPTLNLSPNSPSAPNPAPTPAPPLLAAIDNACTYIITKSINKSNYHSYAYVKPNAACTLRTPVISLYRSHRSLYRSHKSLNRSHRSLYCSHR